jgi:hypothetical protein
VATQDWMKSPKIVLNNGAETMFLHYFNVLKKLVMGFKCAKRYSIFIGLLSNLSRC